jgi:hypothetical protein
MMASVRQFDCSAFCSDCTRDAMGKDWLQSNNSGGAAREEDTL